MIKILLVLMWPAGMALIAATAALAAGRGPRLAWRPPAGHGQVWCAIRFTATVVAGSVAVFLLVWLLGLLVVHAGAPVDQPVYHWTVAHRAGAWDGLMRRATKIGNSEATWAAAGTAGLCLAVAWRRQKWLPPLALGVLFAVQKLLVHGIHHLIHRPGPPGSPLGTFPSGGAARSVAFYGLIAYLLWHEFGGTRRTAVWAAAAVAAIGFNEGYSRAYLTLHWLTDILSGWLQGGLLLAVFVIAVRHAAGPARTRARVPRSEPTGLTTVTSESYT